MARIGLLALQGGYAVHVRTLETCGYEVVEVRRADDLQDLDGLVLPGGESTTHLKLIDRFELHGPLDTFLRSGRPVLATCAGLILASTTVSDPEQRSFGWLDVDVQRNGWGRQVFSFEAMADATPAAEHFGPDPLPLMFIRAPRILRHGPEVQVMATVQGEPVLVRQGNIFGATCHPELTVDTRVHQMVFGP